MRIQARRGAHQHVYDGKTVGLEGRARRGVVDDYVGIFRGKHFGRAVGTDELGAQSLRADPTACEPLVLGRDDQTAVEAREAAALEQRDRRGGDQLHRIEPGVEHLHDGGPALQLGDPIRSGKAGIATAEREHFYDVLGLQHLRLGTRQRDVRAVAARAGTHANAGVGKEGQDAVFHPAFGETQTKRHGARNRCGHRATPCLADPEPPSARRPKSTTPALGGPASAMIQDSTRLRLSPVDRVTVVMPMMHRRVHEP